MVFPHFKLSGWIFIIIFILIVLTLDKPLTRLFNRLCRGNDRLSTLFVWLTALLLSFALSRLVSPGIINFVNQLI